MTDMTQPDPQGADASGAGALPANTRSTWALGWGIAGLFFGLSVPIPVWGLFMLFLAVPLAIAALVNGYSGLALSRTSSSGRSKALAALVLAYATLAICSFTTLFWVITMATAR